MIADRPMLIIGYSQAVPLLEPRSVLLLVLALSGFGFVAGGKSQLVRRSL
ncbi:MAG: hypothetical protein JRG96_14700 [Deltaproteobacteria bacterium]|nr:hypothetical protein [Deltaproteobacteria bacterium]